MGLMDRTPLTVTPIRAPAVLKLHLQLHSSFDISSSKHYWPEKEELRSDSCCVNGGENCFKHKNSTTLQCCEHCHIKKIVTHSLTHYRVITKCPGQIKQWGLLVKYKNIEHYSLKKHIFSLINNC